MTSLFQPQSFAAPEHPGHRASFGERGHGLIYVHDPRITFAVQTAQVTGRPLLLRGPAGSGKSSLAPFVAHTLGVPFYMFTVTARTQARDLMWEFDALARLNDANVSVVDPEARRRVTRLYNYIRPGKLWWAFDPDTARRRGAPSDLTLEVAPATEPHHSPGSPTPVATQQGAVLLIDEIDKADPDVPNNLLEALGSRQFTVHETGTLVDDRRRPLVLITTNEERELPQAFLRRCVTLQLEEKSVPDLVGIAREHFGSHPKLTGFARTHYHGNATPFFEDVARTLDHLRREARRNGERAPSTAEFLDTVAACLELDVQPVAPPPEPQPETTPAPKPPESETARRWRHAIEVALSKRPTPA